MRTATENVFQHLLIIVRHDKFQGSFHIKIIFDKIIITDLIVIDETTTKFALELIVNTEVRALKDIEVYAV